ncbi:tetratricopeptide repeat protein [Candidatus Riflebacteria bacterium]
MQKAEIQAIKYYDRAIERVREKDYMNALEYLQRAIKKYDGNPLFHYVSGFVYHELKENELAKNYYLKTLELSPKHQECLWNLSLVCLESNQLTEAIKYWHLLIEENNDDIEARVNMALAYYTMEEFELAIEEFKDILSLESDNFEAHKNLALIYKKREDFDSCVRHLSRLPLIDPTYEGAVEKERILIESLKLKYNLKKMEATSHQDLMDELRSDDDSYLDETYENLLEQALSAQISGELEQALEKARKALKISSSDVAPYQVIYQVNLAQGNFHEAESAINKALEIEPELAELHNDLGKLFMYQGKYEQALENFKKVRDLEWNFPFVSENILMAEDGLKD